MPEHRSHEGRLELNHHGRRAVDEVIAMRRAIEDQFGGSRSQEVIATLTLAAIISAASGSRVLHDPSDPMSRIG